MTLSLNTNMAASKAAIHLANNTENLNKSLERLSSGKRINSASDDAGGLALSMKLESQISGFKADVKSLGNGISLLQVREGALSQMSDIAVRFSEILNASAGFTVTATDYDEEIAGLALRLVTLSTETFNGEPLFQTAGHIVKTGITVADNDISANAGDYSLVQADGGATNVDFKTITAVADYDQTAVDSLIDAVAKLRASNAGDLSRLQYAQDSARNQVTGLEAALGRIVDVDIAEESANLAKQQILVQASASMVAQANSANNAILKLLQ